MKIANDGEILFKGGNVFLGYYRDEDATDRTIVDGWVYSGDVGTFDENGFLVITDRKKEMFKLSSGKYIAPQVIENKLKESIFVEQAMVVGENEKFASALVSPNFPYLHEWASQQDVKFQDNKELIDIKEIVDRYQEEVSELNKSLGEHEKIKRIRLVPEEWSPQTGEMSQILKLKRRVLYERYDGILQEIYSVGKGSSAGE